MMITRTDHHRAVRELEWTESWPSCACVLIASPGRTATLAIALPVRPSHACPLHSRERIGGEPAHLTTRSSSPHVIQSP
jgi:hypothetical protein